METGDWVQFCLLPESIEVDFHFSEYGPRDVTFWEAMEEVKVRALDSLRKAYERGLRYVIFTHGSSTSGSGRQSARSQVRGVMRSRAATPYIRRSNSIQHFSVYVATIRENPEASLPDLTRPECGNKDVQPKSWAGYFRCRSCRHEFNWFDLGPSAKESI